MIKYCIFDLDGTLLNTIKSINYFVNKTLEGDGLQGITENEAKIFVGDGAKKLIFRAMHSKGITDEERILRNLEIYNKAYDDNPLYLTAPYEGIEKALKDLKEKGIKLAVLSNKPHPTTLQVVDKFFPNTFEVVWGGRQGVPLKPDPTSARAAAEALGANLSELAFIGDTSVDIETGKNLGAKLKIGVLWGFRTREELENAKADKIISHPSELVDAILG